MMSLISKPVAIVIIIVGLLAQAALCSWLAVEAMQSVIADRVQVAVEARDLHWKLEIEKANAVAAANIIEQMRVARAADLVAQAEINRLKSELSELEQKNANLPDYDGSGIDLERARLLNDNRTITNYPH